MVCTDPELRQECFHTPLPVELVRLDLSPHVELPINSRTFLIRLLWNCDTCHHWNLHFVLRDHVGCGVGLLDWNGISITITSMGISTASHFFSLLESATSAACLDRSPRPSDAELLELEQPESPCRLHLSCLDLNLRRLLRLAITGTSDLSIDELHDLEQSGAPCRLLLSCLDWNLRLTITGTSSRLSRAEPSSLR